MTRETDRSAPRSRWAVAAADGGAERSFLDRLFTSLSHQRRRRVLYLISEEGQLSREAVADRLVDQRVDSTPEVERAELRDRLLTELHHFTLPELRDAGLIDYDGRSGTIVQGPELDRARPYLELMREDERF